MWIITVIGHKICRLSSHLKQMFSTSTKHKNKKQFRVKHTGVSLFTVYNCLLVVFISLFWTGTIYVRKNDYYGKLLGHTSEISFKTFNLSVTSLFYLFSLLLSFLFLLLFLFSLFLKLFFNFYFRKIFSHTWNFSALKSSVRARFYCLKFRHQWNKKLWTHSLTDWHKITLKKTRKLILPSTTLWIEIYYSGKRKHANSKRKISASRQHRKH